MRVYCAVVVAVFPDMAGVSVLCFLFKRNVENAFCLEGVEII